MTTHTITVPFEITGWDETTYEEPDGAPKLTRATVRKTYAEPMAGSSVAELLTAQGERGQGYVASERVDAVLDGRAGTFVLQHGGTVGADAQRTFGQVVPGSGTGELGTLSGEVSFGHDESGARVTFTYSL